MDPVWFLDPRGQHPQMPQLDTLLRTALKDAWDAGRRSATDLSPVDARQNPNVADVVARRAADLR